MSVRHQPTNPKPLKSDPIVEDPIDDWVIRPNQRLDHQTQSTTGFQTQSTIWFQTWSTIGLSDPINVPFIVRPFCFEHSPNQPFSRKSGKFTFTTGFIGSRFRFTFTPHGGLLSIASWQHHLWSLLIEPCDLITNIIHIPRRYNTGRRYRGGGHASR